MKKLLISIAALCIACAAQAFPVPFDGINLRASDQSTNGVCISRVIPEAVDGVTATLNACRLGGVGQVWGELINGMYQHTNPAGFGDSYIRYIFDAPVTFTMTLPEVHNSQASGYVLYGTSEDSLVQIPIGGGFTSLTLPTFTTDRFYVGAGSIISGAVIRFGSPPTFGSGPSPSPIPVSLPDTLGLLALAAATAVIATQRGKTQ